MGFTTPIGFLIFNRPELTARVFERIAAVKPEKLYVIADGPRTPEEEEKCLKTRAIIEKVDWDCKVFTDFSEKNLGCGYREASGFSWVFSNEEEAIFVEDDTLPTPSFFIFCQTLLDYYRNDTRIMHISGNNFQFGKSWTQCSYYFSRYTHSWGWASWRRAWKYYDYHMKSWPQFKASGLIKAMFEDPYEQQYWFEIFDRTYENPVNAFADTWDFQWMFAVLAQNGLSVLPDVNLVSNIGFGHPDAVHTKQVTNLANLPVQDIWDIRHPTFIIRNREADIANFAHAFGKPAPKVQSLTVTASGRMFLGALKRAVLSAIRVVPHQESV